MKGDPVARYVVGQLGRLAEREAKKPRPPRQLSPSEQIARFLAGTERSRVLAGEVTPAEFVEYERMMVDHLGAIGALELEGNYGNLES